MVYRKQRMVSAMPWAADFSRPYTAGLVIATTLLVLIVTTIVSFLPTRKIAKLEPTDALRGKLT